MSNPDDDGLIVMQKRKVLPIVYSEDEEIPASRGRKRKRDYGLKRKRENNDRNFDPEEYFSVVSTGEKFQPFAEKTIC